MIEGVKWIYDQTKISRSTIIIAAILTVVVGCVDPYPLEESGFTQNLVVEGLITNELKNHKIALSRTSRLNEQRVIPETGASVSIISEGTIIGLVEVQPGVYQTPLLAGVIGSTYQLNITTAGSKNYTSAVVELKDVPQIKNIYAAYRTNQPGKENGIEIFLDGEASTTHTDYYRWDVVETYEIQTPRYSFYEWIGGNEVVTRDPPIDHCWATDTLKSIMIHSTTSLEKDQVQGFSLRYIEESDPVFRIKYSALIRQYALTEETYAFWENLRIMNETQGSLYDIQPGTLTGNITSESKPSEVVLGFFEASAVSERRVFFHYRDFVDDGYQRPKFRSSCLELVPIFVPQQQLGEYMEQFQDQYHIWDVIGLSPNITFELLPKPCCDCTDMGTNIEPEFWTE